jgi:serine protease Do
VSLSLKSDKGALVADVQNNSPASHSDIKAGDVITKVNGQQVDGPRDLARTIAGLGPKKKVDLTYVRDGSDHTVSVELGKLPNDKQAKNSSQHESHNSHGQLSRYGMTVAPASDVAGAGDAGLVISNINPDGPAAAKGLRSGDVILEAAGHAVSQPSDLTKALDQARKDGRKAVLLRVRSNDNTHFVALATNPVS